MARPYESYIIAAKQAVDWDTGAKNAQLQAIIYELRDESLKIDSPMLISPRFTGHPSQIPGIFNRITAGGSINMDLHADDMLLWWQQMLMTDDTDISSNDFTAQEVFGSGTGAGKAFGASPESLDTQPGSTTPSSSPGRLVMTLGGADSGVVTLTGTDQNDVAITDTLTFAAETGPKTTAKYFKTVTSVAYTGLTVGVAETWLIMCDKNTYSHNLILGDDPLKGLTIEKVTDTVPTTFIGCLINNFTLTLDDIMTLGFEFVAKMGWENYIIHSSTEGDPEASVTPTDVSGFTRVSQNVNPGWASALYLDAAGAGSEEELASMTFTLNNNLNPRKRSKLSRYYSQPNRGGRRDPVFTFAIDYDSDNDGWETKALYGIPIDADFWAYCKPYAGPELSIHISLPNCELVNVPDRPLNSFEEHLQTIQLRPLRTSSATTSDEIEVDLVCTAAS